MAPQTLTAGPGKRAGRESRCSTSTYEASFADRTLGTFGRCGAGWFGCCRQRGYPPSGLVAGPFSTSYAAYRHVTINP